MPRMSQDLKDLYELRDLIADAIIDYEKKHRGRRVVLLQEYDHDTPMRAKIGQIAAEIVDPAGEHKATTYRSLSE